MTVTEQIPDTRQPFITYDEHTYSYLVTVTDNMQEGRLETAISEVTGDTTFTNTYDAGSSTKTVGTAEDPTTNIDGQMVGVGSELVYTIHWVNDYDNRHHPGGNRVCRSIRWRHRDRRCRDLESG